MGFRTSSSKALALPHQKGPCRPHGHAVGGYPPLCQMVLVSFAAFYSAMATPAVWEHASQLGLEFSDV